MHVYMQRPASPTSSVLGAAKLSATDTISSNYLINLYIENTTGGGAFRQHPTLPLALSVPARSPSDIHRLVSISRSPLYLMVPTSG